MSSLVLAHRLSPPRSKVDSRLRDQHLHSHRGWSLLRHESGVHSETTIHESGERARVGVGGDRTHVRLSRLQNPAGVDHPAAALHPDDATFFFETEIKAVASLRAQKEPWTDVRYQDMHSGYAIRVRAATTRAHRYLAAAAVP